jgi:hypothetical protein
MTGAEATLSATVSTARSIGRATKDHALRAKAQQLRVEAIGQHLLAVHQEAVTLWNAISDRATFQDGTEANETSRAVVLAQDAVEIISNACGEFETTIWSAPLDSEHAQALLLLNKTAKAATSMLATTGWTALRSFSPDEPTEELLRPLQTKAMDLAVDGHWLSTVVSHLIDAAEASRMQKHRARRRARLHQTTLHYHENEVKTLEKIGLLNAGETHSAADVQKALSTFVSMSLELAENAAIRAGRAPDEGSGAEAWGRLMSEFLAAGRAQP